MIDVQLHSRWLGPALCALPRYLPQQAEVIFVGDGLTNMSVLGLFDALKEGVQVGFAPASLGPDLESIAESPEAVRHPQSF